MSPPPGAAARCAAVSRSAAVFALLLWGASAAAQSDTTRVRSILQDSLSLGQPAAGRLSPPATDRWALRLEAGEYAEVEVRRQEIDVGIRVLTPSGALKHATADETDDCGCREFEKAARWIADTGGSWLVEVVPQPNMPPAPYEIRWTVRRQPSPVDRQVVRADTLSRLGLQLASQGALARADTLLRRSLAIRETALGDGDPQVALNLAELADVEEQRERFLEAEQLQLRALAIREKALGPENPDVAINLHALAWLSLDQGHYARSDSLFHRALGVAEKVFGSDHAQVADVLNDMGVLYRRQGRYADSERVYRRALATLERVLGSGNPELGGNYHNLALLYSVQGRYAEAEAFFRRALAAEAALSPKDSSKSALSLISLGALYRDQGRYQEAQTPLYRAVQLLENGASSLNLARALKALASVYEEQGRYLGAEPLLRRALLIDEKVGGPEHPELAPDLDMLGRVYDAQGRSADAEGYYLRALAIREKALGPEHPDVVQSLDHLAHLYREQGRLADAESLRRRALAIDEKVLGPEHPDVAAALVGLAQILSERDSSASAVRPLLDRAITILERQVTSLETRSDAYALRARVRRQAGDTAGAYSDLSEALALIEQMRPRVGGGDETRANLLDRYAQQFDLMVRWQVQAGDIRRAFEYLERGRARVLLDQLSAGEIDLRKSIPPAIRGALEARETDARAREAEYRQRLQLLRSRGDLSRQELERQQALLEDSLRIADRDFGEVYEETKSASPLWRGLVTSDGQAVSLDTVQRRLVPRGGFLLAYEIGKDTSDLFLIPPAGAVPQIVTLTVAAREAAVLGVRPGPLTGSVLTKVMSGAAVSPGVAPRSRSIGLSSLLGRSPALRSAAARRNGTELAGEKLMLERLHALWNVLVPEAVWQQLRIASQVVVVPGRGLYLLPFEALVVMPAGTSARARFWLDEGPSIRYAASATTLFNLEQRSPGTSAMSTPPSVLSVTDPAYDVGVFARATLDTRRPVPRKAAPRAQIQGAGEAAPAEESASLPAQSYVRGGGSLKRLPGAAAETEAIRRAFADQPGARVSVLRGEQATEARLLAALRQEQPRYLHLATHAQVSEEQDGMFAALALTPPVTDHPSPDDDGFLELHEIYQLRLDRVDLAVLSACETNGGTAIGGEGVFALSRGFLTAGARRVVASDWAVEDRSTAALMGRFFQEIAAAERTGKTVDYPEALQRARRAVRNGARWSDPYYWAPFVLTGIH